MKKNANEILANVTEWMERLETETPSIGSPVVWKGWKGKKALRIARVNGELSIFDWWNEDLSMHQLKQMKKFLETAISLGYTGYVCFKVGAAGCSHGMWAHKKESTDGYSPDGACLYHSFRSGDNYYDACDDKGVWLHDVFEQSDYSLKEIKELLKLERVTGKSWGNMK